MPQIVKQYHVRHILIKVNELTSDEEAHQKINSIRDQLIKDNGNTAKQNKDFIDLAKRYSEDTSSIKGGDIGWVSKGDTVPQFEQAMLKTPVGQISEPVRSPFGWHLLEVTETRDSNLANDKEKAEIRQELREMKAQMLYTEWVRNLREMAYVKLNDN
ncbi:peptidylprolyl isomerase [Aquella oligotrophica]|nr:peptidylprolyl isomerase [Aquella oligotrophica]